MKKLIPIAAVAVLAMMFTSCKKDYTCTCKVTGMPDATYEFKKAKKKDAKAACDTWNTTVSIVGGSCSL